ILVFFSIPVGKRDVYLMPAIPMVALAMAPYLEAMAGMRWLRNTAFAIAALGGAAIIVAGLWASFGHSQATQRFIEQRELEDLGHMVWSMVIAIGVAFVL